MDQMSTIGEVEEYFIEDGFYVRVLHRNHLR